jgi:hypothetical protein
MCMGVGAVGPVTSWWWGGAKVPLLSLQVFPGGAGGRRKLPFYYQVSGTQSGFPASMDIV